MEPTTRNCNTTYKSTLADGTVKVHERIVKYKVSGFVHEDGSVHKFSEEQIADMKRRHADGVTKKRLAQDYNTYYNTITKYLSM